jgi:hypothetical protein
LLEELATIAEHDLYPLLHHYNMTQWLNAIRIRFPEPIGPPRAFEHFDFPSCEQDLIDALLHAAGKR